ncbi:alpha/beta hydrolase [Synechococcus sp. CBW1002]|nr:alpha/beta hydrolase [Synechococcus sp. CBW1002]QPN68512.1 alpha/beta hydrolase [Synechococcus sp. CBW1006]
MGSRFWIATLLVVASYFPASPALSGVPVRLSTGSGVWSSDREDFETFLKDGRTSDRGIASLVRKSGWTADEVRAGFLRLYSVDVAGLARFLNSEPGVIFLKNQTRSYIPYASLSEHRVEALRSAILADAADGEISAAGILATLPTDFRLARLGGYDGVQNVCAELRCEGSEQCTSLLSWYMFLPACLEANAMATAVDEIDFSPLEPNRNRRPR